MTEVESKIKTIKMLMELAQKELNKNVNVNVINAFIGASIAGINLLEQDLIDGAKY